MNVKELKTKYCLEAEDLPNKNGINVLSIVDLERSTFTANEGGRQVPKTRTNLWFRELQLPLRLNNTRLDILEKLLGSETDHWKGRKIGLFIAAVSEYGKTKLTILIDLQVHDAPGPQIGSGPVTQGQIVAKPDAPIGDANAERFQLALAEQGAKYDDFLLWLKRVDRPAHDSTIGMDLADLKRSIAPLMQRFLREFGSTPTTPAAPAEVIDKPAANSAPTEAAPTHPRNQMGDPVAAIAPDDDIPF